MPRNEERRRALADAGLAVLAEQGARGLTHRAVDRAAGTPLGTASNYFRTRDDLLAALVERIGELFAPEPEVLRERAGATPDAALFAQFMRDIVRRLLGQPQVTLALFELRLESVRRPEVAELLGPWRREGFAADVAFHREAGLPGGEREVALFHYAMDGLLLDRLAGSLRPAETTDDVIDALVAGLLPDGPGAE
ncbi:TetR family transcriptional regulator [Brachybacterium ginsengisoli]|uniref:TetR family transcriptional regulator n=1 Tax=Brachybacterium ginsengisoli TaxID=1331682 RepID=A0A291GU48_9MICO|nr:TetR/AcrR family transcriptional regulator [Brachybacterium ginsengisoli]ATG53700.1 TetR family transcriptional regulator [Brachybacterium ginsengisoli]